jgi:hypothetical protein
MIMERREMKRNSVVHLFIVSLLMVFLLEGGALAEDPNDPNSCGCCEVDKPEDAPPAGSSISISSTAPLVMTSTSSSSNTKTFRTDTGPELDWYQPCSGGDNLIDFNINVHDVDISAIESARLALSVWDVDYNCGGACWGVCERDTVYLNGHRLTSPVAYLTGANNQWSSVSFDVDISWIVEGNNYIQIFIDTLSYYCWCVTCDWGELQLEVAEVDVKVVEIEALEDTSIRDDTGNAITDSIWSDDSPSQHKSVADASKDGWWIFTWGGSLKIQTHLDAEPSKPIWDPKCKYAWWILGTNKSDSGEFTGWDDDFTVTMPEKVGKYQLTLMYEIYDDQDNQINFQSMTHTLYVTYQQSLLSKPKTVWLDKACEWASGATDPTGVVQKMNSGIYNNSGWDYTYPNASWQKLVEASDTKGDCVSFANVWCNLSKCLGVAASLPTFYRGQNGMGLVTITPATALDGNPGNAYPGGSSLANADRWRFSGHQVGQYGSLFSMQYYDPTTGNIYNTYNEYVEWDLEQKLSGVPYQIGRKGSEYVKVFDGVGPPPWGGFEYFGPYTSSSSSSSSVFNQAASSAASSTGTYTEEGIDSDGNGKYNYLSIKAEIDVTSSGEYGIYGTLFFNGEQITSRPSAKSSMLTYYHLSAGPSIHEAILQFSGEDIYESGKSGIYTVELRIIDNGGSLIDTLSFDTRSYIYTEFREIPAELSGSADEGNDVDGDGLYEYLTAQISVDVSSAMNYILEGTLESTDGNVIDATSYEAFLDSSGTIEIRFDGRKIRRSEQNGPYVLSVTLTDENHSQIDRQAFNTSAYSYTEFESLIAQFSGDYADSGSDVDGDGLFDYLTLEAQVEVVENGNYGVIGTLADDVGAEIAGSQIHMSFAVGTNQAILRFEGMEIHRHGKDGPYNLKSIVLYDAVGNVVDARSNVYSTSSYSYEDFEAPSSALQHTFTDYGVDTNGDGYFELLVVEVGVDVASAGNYLLRGALHDTNGDEIVLTSTDSYLNPGNQSMQLQFDGFSIYKHRVNGPYNLSYVILCTDNSRLMDAQAEAHVTSAYNYQNFQRPPVVLTGNYSDNAIDLNSDGVYEYLRVNVEVIVANSGTYALNARLMDKDENEIVWASTTAWLPADQAQTMQLNFNGSSIYNHGVNGPYYLRDVYVYNMSNISLSDYVYDAYTTINHWTVGNNPPTANAGPDQNINCAYNTEQGTTVTLDGTGSDDPDGDSLTYTWTGPFDESPTHGPTPTVTLSPGCPADYVITLVVNDGTEDSDPDEVVVTVQDPVAAVTYDGDTLLSTAGNPTVGATLIATTRDLGGNLLNINGARITFTLTAEGIEPIIVVTTLSENGTATTSQELEPAIYKIDMTLDCSDTTASAILVVYNPEGGFATGGGWIVPDDDGLNTHPNVRANFGFNAKYKQNDPTGHIEFRYSDGHIDLKSSSIEQLVITGGKIVQFKGWASVNKEQGHWFFVKAIDEGEPGVLDTFDIKVWAPGVDTEGDPTERAGGVLEGGNIVVHAK